jgi:hypothetical protein
MYKTVKYLLIKKCVVVGALPLNANKNVHANKYLYKDRTRDRLHSRRVYNPLIKVKSVAYFRINIYLSRLSSVIMMSAVSIFGRLLF